MYYKNNSVFLFLNISKSRPLGVLKSDFLWSGSGQGFDYEIQKIETGQTFSGRLTLVNLWWPWSIQVYTCEPALNGSQLELLEM